MNAENQSQATDIYKLDSYESPTSTSDSAALADVIGEHSLVLVRVGEHHLVMTPQEVRNLSKDHRIICYADSETGLVSKHNGERLKRVQQDTMADFLDGMVTALNLAAGEELTSSNATQTEPLATKPEPKDPAELAEISECRESLTSEQVQLAIKKALKLVSKSMASNIDGWVIEAGESINRLSSTLSIEDTQRSKSIAVQLQNSSAKLSKQFQARLIECLHKFNHPEKEQIDVSAKNLSLAKDGDWHKQTAILSLADTVTGQAKLDFNQLNRRFSYLLNRRVKPEKNVIGPEMLAWSMCSAIDDMGMNKQQVEALQDVLTKMFHVALGKMYREINLLWIGMDIIPQIKLRVWQDNYKPGSNQA